MKDGPTFVLYDSDYSLDGSAIREQNIILNVEHSFSTLSYLNKEYKKKSNYDIILRRKNQC